MTCRPFLVHYALTEIQTAADFNKLAMNKTLSIRQRTSNQIECLQYVMSGKLLAIEGNISNLPICHHLLPTDRFVSTITNIRNMLETPGGNVPTLYKHQAPQAPLFQSYYIYMNVKKRIKFIAIHRNLKGAILLERKKLIR